MYKQAIQRAAEPYAFLTQGRQRVKQHRSSVYLKDGDEFEIELFNPTNLKVLAKIKLNGTYLSSGIILRPGERVFLERHLDESKKFLFETYAVDANDPETQQAIRDNGRVEVEFYQEEVFTPYAPQYTWTVTNNYDYTGNPPPSLFNTISSSNVNSDTVSIPINYSSPAETGRVEKGDHSSQEFESETANFYSWYSWKSEWQILPASQKLYVSKEIVVYCTDCGARRKKPSFKFCPHCGNKF